MLIIKICVSLAESFYNVKNGSSIITSKSSPKNLSNENKHTLCFQRIGILIHILSWRQQKHQCTAVFVFITEILWQTFWRNNWWSVFDIAKILRTYVLTRYNSLNFAVSMTVWIIRKKSKCRFLKKDKFRKDFNPHCVYSISQKCTNTVKILE